MSLMLLVPTIAILEWKIFYLVPLLWQKSTGIEKYWCSSYGIGLDRRLSFSFPGGRYDQNVLIFGADMSSSNRIDNNKKDILVLGVGPTQGLEHTLTAKKMYSVNFIVMRKKLQWCK